MDDNGNTVSVAELEGWPVDEVSVATIRTLAMDAVQKAESGHPGTPMALAPLAYVLWTKFLRHDPRNPTWFDRDRFVLSNGHASMLLYAMLYLTGYDLTLEDIEHFRQWGSKTPGHPERSVTPGVETTTGPLGQGFMNAVGMAMAEAHLAATFNREGFELIDHFTYAFCSDGDLMEGASHEAASLAGHLGLGKLVCVYDDNHISIEGETEITYSDRVATRFEGYGWDVQDLGDAANDLDSITRAIARARDEHERPSLIVLRSHIAYGSPNFQDTREAHGSPLGKEEVERTKRVYGWPEKEKFLVPDRVLEHMGAAVERGKRINDWHEKIEGYRKAYPELARRLEEAVHGELPAGWDSEIPRFSSEEGPMATRSAAAKALNAFAPRVPWLVGGSADLAPSTKTLMDASGYFARGQYENRNVAWGVREHNMVASCSGMAVHGGVRPFCASFLVFTDYARPAIRLAALMGLPVVYLMTHDSIGLGQDGPTHQPIEHLASLRAMPNLDVIRPADANETAQAWRAALDRQDGPTLIALTRQKLPIQDRSQLADASGLRKGAYVLAREQGDAADVVLLGSGSEVSILLEGRRRLARADVDARVVSIPSWELFRRQSREYRQDVLPPGVRARLAVEAGSVQGWREWVGDAGDVLGIDEFGASAPGEVVLERFGFSADNVVERVKSMIGRRVAGAD